MLQTVGQIVPDRTEFFRRMLAGRRFLDVYESVMATVENCASYLDGEGRRERAAMTQQGQANCARHSMWLTAGLMRLASVVLVLRAVGHGEMSMEVAMAEIEKTQFSNGLVTLEPFEGMPARLAELVDAHEKARSSVERLMRSIAPKAAAPENPAREWLRTIEEQFAAGGRNADLAFRSPQRSHPMAT